MNEKKGLMIKVAKLYYESGLTQEMISRRLRISRPTISRLMQDAIEKGIVKITIVQDVESHADIERELSEKFGLLEIIVADYPKDKLRGSVVNSLGLAAANYFHRIVRDGDTIGLTWGTTLSAMVDHLGQYKLNNVSVIQMVGGLGEPSANTHATDLVRRVSLAIGATVRLMPAPGIVKNIEVSQLLRGDPYISLAIEAASKVNVAFVGIGALSKNELLVRDESIITWDEVQSLKSRGAVGEIGLHFYDECGNLIESDLEKRIIGVELNKLRALERIVGIAGGEEKFEAILGAVRGHVINTLITDIDTADRLMKA